jgi:hypothetical protein
MAQALYLAYKTEDGRIFEDREEAEEHEHDLLLLSIRDFLSLRTNYEVWKELTSPTAGGTKFHSDLQSLLDEVSKHKWRSKNLEPKLEASDLESDTTS